MDVICNRKEFVMTDMTKELPERNEVPEELTWI